jgi:hypothetical protein
VFPVRYELNVYILFGRISVFKGLRKLSMRVLSESLETRNIILYRHIVRQCLLLFSQYNPGIDTRCGCMYDKHGVSPTVHRSNRTIVRNKI